MAVYPAIIGSVATMTVKMFTSFTYQLLISALVLTCRLGVHGGVIVIPLEALLLYDGRAGHAEQPVDVDAHFHLHLGVVAVMLGTNVLNSETPLETTEVGLNVAPKCRERGGGKKPKHTPLRVLI